MKAKFTTLKRLCILTLFAGLMFISQVNSQTWTIYDAGVLPDGANPAWTPADNGTATYSIEDDAEISGNKILYETSAASADKQSYKLNITQPTKGTWMIRTKAGNNNPTSMEFEFNTSDGASPTPNRFRIHLRLYVHPTKGGYVRTQYLSTNVAYPADSSLNVKEFHTYRITAENLSSFKVYLDENPTPVITGEGATGSSQGQFLRFGDVGSTFTEGYLDWMAWDTSGVYAPGTGTLPAGVKIDGIITAIKSNVSPKLAAFPNPATNQLNVKNASAINRYEIISTGGKLVRKAVNNENSIKINLTGLKPGMYILKTYSNGEIEQTKFIKK